MNEQKYLNYTHGMVLQTLCQEMQHRLSKGLSCVDLVEWAEEERTALLKKPPLLWDRPVSQQTYLAFLQELVHAHEPAALDELLTEIEGITRDRIHILFLTQEPLCWSSLKSVFEAAQQDEEIEASLVYTPYFHKNYEAQNDYFEDYRAMSLPVIRWDAYTLAEHSPDVAFLIKPYANTPEPFQTKELERVIPRLVYIPYGMEITTDLIRYAFRYYLHYRAWRHCAYGNIVKEYAETYGYRNGDNLVVWGHPKADQYARIDAYRQEAPSEWKEKIAGRKTILWTPHHLIDIAGNGTGTWLAWGEKLLSLALKRQDVAFIFRPHPMLMGALVNGEYVSRRQMERLKKRIRNAPNIIWDDTGQYMYAMSLADAIITDGTTFSVEFLYTHKPILLTARNMKGFYMYEDMKNSYYIMKEIKDAELFVNMVSNGEDPLYDKRQAMFRKHFFVPDTGSVGQYIVEHLKADLACECRNLQLITGTTA